MSSSSSAGPGELTAPGKVAGPGEIADPGVVIRRPPDASRRHHRAPSLRFSAGSKGGQSVIAPASCTEYPWYVARLANSLKYLRARLALRFGKAPFTARP